tara:strand:- start:699 stop:851 length:153 start_codon:yes stop_codon:yes gene_type:complete
VKEKAKSEPSKLVAEGCQAMPENLANFLIIFTCKEERLLLPLPSSIKKAI